MNISRNSSDKFLNYKIILDSGRLTLYAGPAESGLLISQMEKMKGIEEYRTFALLNLKTNCKTMRKIAKRIMEGEEVKYDF
jgi:hypothetical protein